MNIGIFFGSTTGNTTAVAEAIAKELESFGKVTLHNMADSDLSTMSEYDLIILGASTWGFGEIQEDWFGSESLPCIDLSGKNVAIFGLGDQSGFSDTFVDAIGILTKSAENAGATLIGKWPIDGYEFSNSAAVRNNMFYGLAIDEDNQSDQTSERVLQWINQLKKELG